MSLILKSTARLTVPPLYLDIGGLPNVGLPVLARADFENEAYSLNGQARTFADMFTQVAGAAASYYDPASATIRTVATGTPLMRGPMGRKALVLAGLDATLFHGTATGSQTLTFSASAWNGKTVMIAVWGRDASLTVSGDCTVIGGNSVARTYAPLAVTLSAPGGATNGTLTLTVGANAVFWMVTRYPVVDGSGPPSFVDRSYATTAGVVSAAAGARTHVFRVEYLKYVGFDTAARVGLEIASSTHLLWVMSQPSGQSVFKVADAAGNTLLQEPLTSGSPIYQPVTVAIATDPAAGTIRVAANGELVTTYKGVASGWAPSGITLGRVPRSATTPRCMITQSALLQGAATDSQLRGLSSAFI